MRTQDVVPLATRSSSLLGNPMTQNPRPFVAENHTGGKSRKGVGGGGMGGEMSGGVAQPKPSLGGTQPFEQVVRVM